MVRLVESPLHAASFSDHTASFSLLSLPTAGENDPNNFFARPSQVLEHSVKGSKLHASEGNNCVEHEREPKFSVYGWWQTIASATCCKWDCVEGYVYSGTELVIDTRKSPSLKDSKNPSDWHNLQAILHIVAGWNGEKEEFKLRVKRSLALVNKSCEYLKDECLVPGIWWVEKNKGLVFDEDLQDWVLAPPSDEDLPVPNMSIK